MILQIYTIIPYMERSIPRFNTFLTFRGVRYHLSPLAVAEDSNEDVEGVEGGLEGDVLVEVEDAGDYINGNPNEPLFQVLVRQGPDAHDAEGSGETVGQGDVGVSVGGQEPVDEGPNASGNEHPRQDKAAREMGDPNHPCPSLGRRGKGMEPN